MNRVLHGDAIDVLRVEVADRSVDMVYCDPPFGNGQVWKGAAGSFDDRWTWSPISADGWSALRAHNAAGADLMAAVATTETARAYLGFMAGLLVELRRVLKLTGTLWLHFDDTFGAELRLLCGTVFGVTAEIGTLIWIRTVGGHANANSFGRVHDTIACYGRSRAAAWRLWRLGTIGGDPISRDFWRFDDFARARPLNSFAAERVGYPTQKPVALLEELIRVATLPGAILLDPTCGSGTALVAAERLKRRFIGVDKSADAVAVARKRLEMARPLQTAFDFGDAA